MKLLDLIKNLFKKEEQMSEKDETTKELEELIRVLTDTTPVTTIKQMAEIQGVVTALNARHEPPSETPDPGHQTIEEAMAQITNVGAEIEGMTTNPSTAELLRQELTMDRKDSLDAIQRDEAEMTDQQKIVQFIDAEINNQSLIESAEELKILILGLPTKDPTLSEETSEYVQQINMDGRVLMDRDVIALELLKALVIGYGKPLELVSRDHSKFLIANALSLTDAFIAELKK